MPDRPRPPVQPRTTLRLLIALTVSAVAAACSEGASGGAGDLVVRADSAGIEIVASSGPAAGIEVGGTLVPTLSIGLLDGPPELQLYNVVGAARLSGGGILIANAGSHELRWFDAAGAHVRTAGGEGDGPGEFRRIAALAVGPGDSALVWDGQARRVSVFGPDGAFVRSFALRAGETRFPTLVDTFEDGDILARVGVLVSEPLQDFETFGTDILWQVFTRDGEAADSIGEFPSSRAVIRTMDSGGFAFYTIPYLPQGRVAVGGARVFEGDGSRFEIRVRDSGGSIRRILRRSHQPVTVTRELLDREFEAQYADLENVGFKEAGREAFEAMPEGHPIPAFDALLATPDGTLWVRGTALTGDATHTWSIFDPTGVWVRDVTTPEGLAPYEAGANWLLGRLRDELDVEQVVLFELEP